MIDALVKALGIVTIACKEVGIAEDREKLEAMAEPVPAALFEEIKIWVARQKVKGLSDRAIRRAVKQKWNIDYKM